jgi:tryptophan 7-halogenase
MPLLLIEIAGEFDVKEDRIRSIAIIGGGTAGWMTAAALSKVLGRDYATITLVESDAIGTVGVGEATIPQINVFNRMLGIDEDDFVRRTKGSFKLGIQFVDWAKKGQSYFHPFGKYGLDMEGVSFHAYWLRLYQQGLAPWIDEFSIESKAALEGKFMRPIDAGNSPLSQIAYAFHFDAGLYALFLREYAEKAGVIRKEGKVTKVNQKSDNGFIESVEMEDGSKVAADFFIDCSGFHGLLIEQTMKAGYTDWSKYLPCNRAMAVPCVGGEEITPYTRSTAREAGWQWRIPLQHRTGNGYVYCSDFISDDDARETLLANLDGEPLAEPRIIRFTTGHRNKYWMKNCVAIGLSSGFMEPLESTSIWMIQTGIARLLTMFPAKNFAPVDIDRYNRVLTGETEVIRDFLILHYKATQRDDTPFWDYCRSMEIPDRLEEKIRVFENSGRCFRENDELFNDTSWFAVMTGQLMTAQSYDPVAQLMSLEETQARLKQIQETVTNSADYMPVHRDFIRDHCAA